MFRMRLPEMETANEQGLATERATAFCGFHLFLGQC